MAESSSLETPAMRALQPTRYGGGRYGSPRYGPKAYGEDRPGTKRK